MAFSKKNDHDFSSKMLKSQEKTKTDVKTIRFQIALAESNEKTCPELSYKDLVEGEVILVNLFCPKQRIRNLRATTLFGRMLVFM